MPREKRGNGERGPDKRPRKGSPRLGRKAPKKGASARDDSPSRAKRARALALLVEGSTVEEAAADPAVAVHPSTLYRWLEGPLGAELDSELEKVVSSARRYLRGQTMEAAKGLVSLGKTAGKEHAPRVKAWAEVLDRAGVITPKEVKVTMDATVKDVSAMSEEELAAERARLAGGGK